MKVKSVSGFLCYVQDLSKTIEFYEQLGFDFKIKEETHARAYMNWYSIDFEVAETSENRGEGIFIYLSVDDVDATYEESVSMGLEPLSEPVNEHGNREFTVKDPDGYKLVFFKRK
jgi:predicted enzyme related to lactoylglutathione lyase